MYKLRSRRSNQIRVQKRSLASKIIAVILAVVLALVIMLSGAGAYHQAEQQQVSWVIRNRPEPVTYMVDMPVHEEPKGLIIEEPTPEELEEEAYYDSLELLAMCVEAEAGNQSLYGKRLVVDVILNRVDDQTGNWPDTISEVITQPYQFSTYWNGAIEKAVPSEETFEAVRLELEERTNAEILFFTAEGWGNYGTPWKQIEDHYFSTW